MNICARKIDASLFSCTVSASPILLYLRTKPSLSYPLSSTSVPCSNKKARDPLGNELSSVEERGKGGLLSDGGGGRMTVGEQW